MRSLHSPFGLSRDDNLLMFDKLTKPDIATNWDRFVLEHDGSFLQSWAWGEFQKSLGRQIWRIGGGQVIRHRLLFGKSYLYCPRGPIPSLQQIQGKLSSGQVFRIDNFLSEIEKIRNKKDVFLRIEPSNFSPPRLKSGGSVEGGGFKKLPWDIQPSRTIILDIKKTEEELLSRMHQKHRYNIRLAERKGVKVRVSENGKDFEDFWQLLQATARRGKFRTHPKEHYEKLLATDDQNLKIVLFAAEYKKQIIAADIVNFFGDKAVYMHGASSFEHRALMAPHLLQWEQIKEAKRRECQEYDFWGIDEQKWPGVTRFKQGFGGRGVQYPGTFDLVFNKLWYKMYRLGRKVL